MNRDHLRAAIEKPDPKDKENYRLWHSRMKAAIEKTGIEKPSDYTLVLEEVGRMEAEEKLAQHVEELARAWASIDGKADKFDACKADDALEDELGHYEGYVTEVRELLRRSPITLRALVKAVREVKG